VTEEVPLGLVELRLGSRKDEVRPTRSEALSEIAHDITTEYRPDASGVMNETEPVRHATPTVFESAETETIFPRRPPTIEPSRISRPTRG
jgi:hypothetical protein